MYGVIDTVTNAVRIVVTKGSLKWSDDDSDQQVLLPFSYAEALNSGAWQLRLCRLGKDRDFLDDVGAISEFITYSVAYVLRRIVLVHSDREVPSYGWKV
jgi:hypothetical protein